MAAAGRARPYAASVRAHSETVLRGFYDFHLAAGSGPIMNPFPLDRALHPPPPRLPGRLQGRHRPPRDSLRALIPHRGDVLMRLIGADLALAPLDKLFQLRQELTDHPRPVRPASGQRPAKFALGHIPCHGVVRTARQLGGVPQRPRQVVGLQNVHDLLGRLHSSPPGN